MQGKGLSVACLELSRDVYGFAVRPQHLQRYREYARIYKVEEEERSQRWQHFLETYDDSTRASTLDFSSSEQLQSSLEDPDYEDVPANTKTEDFASSQDKLLEEENVKQDREIHKVQTWSQIRPSLEAIEQNLSARIRKRKISSGSNRDANNENRIPSADEFRSLNFGSPTRPYLGASEEDSEEEFYDLERTDPILDASSNDSTVSDSAANVSSPRGSPRGSCPWKEELECLVRGGVPMALRTELWQVFVGTRTRKIENYYDELLKQGGEGGSDSIKDGILSSNAKINGTAETSIVEKWTSQIEKDLPRTFPGHPALDEDGRDALRRLLTAYARHNPSVGYCQAMNFFAGLLLLLMPEENAFWTLTGIMDDYFCGYYSEKMVEAQVDQLVYEDLVRECFPRLVAHLDNLGVQVAWVTGPWFLSIFVNVLPWESVLRVWDVLLYEGNRAMLFRTALALMELHGPALVATKDAGDAVTLLQSLAGSTFDSSQLVLTACMGYQAVDEIRLQELRSKHRPTVLAAIHERSKEPRLWRSSQGLTSKLFNGNHEEDANIVEGKLLEGSGQSHVIYPVGDLISEKNGSIQQNDFDNFNNDLPDNNNASSVTDLQEQVVDAGTYSAAGCSIIPLVKWLKVELCRALEDKRSATLRAEELETALVEMVKADNRRLLSAKLEELEAEMVNLKQAIAEKQEQEHVMLQVMMRVEHEQRLTEDARRFAEQDAAAQRHAANVLQEKYEEAMNKLAEMEKRAVMAESMLEATLQYEAGQVTPARKPPDSPSIREEAFKITLQTSSPRDVDPDSWPVNINQEIQHEQPARRLGLLSRPFGLGWRDRNKGKLVNLESQGLPSSAAAASSEYKLDTPLSEDACSQLVQKDTNGFSDAHGSENKDEPNVPM